MKSSYNKVRGNLQRIPTYLQQLNQHQNQLKATKERLTEQYQRLLEDLQLVKDLIEQDEQEKQELLPLLNRINECSRSLNEEDIVDVDEFFSFPTITYNDYIKDMNRIMKGYSDYQPLTPQQFRAEVRYLTDLYNGAKQKQTNPSFEKLLNQLLITFYVINSTLTSFIIIFLY